MHAKYSLVHARMTLFSDKISYGKNNFILTLTITQSINCMDMTVSMRPPDYFRIALAYAILYFLTMQRLIILPRLL